MDGIGSSLPAPSPAPSPEPAALERPPEPAPTPSTTSISDTVTLSPEASLATPPAAPLETTPGPAAIAAPPTPDRVASPQATAVPTTAPEAAPTDQPASVTTPTDQPASVTTPTGQPASVTTPTGQPASETPAPNQPVPETPASDQPTSENTQPDPEQAKTDQHVGALLGNYQNQVAPENPAFTAKETGGQVTEPFKFQSPTEGTLVEMNRRQTEAHLSGLAGQLAEGSPRAAQALEEFRRMGGKIVDGGKAGWFQEGPPPVIAIPTNRPGITPAAQMGVLAHELGHFDFHRQGRDAHIPPTQVPGVSDHHIRQGREHEYVRSNAQQQLLNEAHATRFNSEVRDDLLRGGKQRIDVPGVDAGPLRRPAPAPELADQIGRLNPSTAPEKTYRDYYQEHYQRVFQQLFMRQ